MLAPVCYRKWFLCRVILKLWVALVVFRPVAGLRPLRETARSWGDEWLYARKDESEFGPFSPWNITGTYRGAWKFTDSANSSSKFQEFRKSSGASLIELVSTPTKITGVHYVQGVVIFHDVYDSEHNVGGARIRVEGVYIWPFRQLRMVAYSGKDGDMSREEEYLLSNPYHLLGAFSSQVFQESPQHRKKKHSPMHDMQKHCNIEISAQISRASSSQNDGILLGGILIMYEFHNYLRPIIFLVYSFWIPQIVSNIIRDSRKPLHPYYIVGVSLTRLAIPLYIFGCPHNFMRIEPDENWCICLAVFVSLQAAILLLQHYLGSRCFIPSQILPEKYSYHRRFDQDTNLTIDCVICMTSIDLPQRSNDCMVTPCDHFFHSGCLQRWMDIKMECPTCRRPLPPA